MEWIIKIVIACFLGLLAVVDYKKKQVSNIALLIGLVIVIVNYVVFQPITIISLIGGVLIGFTLLGISYITRQKIGVGDGLLIILLGANLGFEGIILVLLYALTLSALWSAALLIIKKVNRHYTIAFIPFIFISYIGVLIDG
jgi:leader peptidase (prepilin peptidase) / N-methyltransferase